MPEEHHELLLHPMVVHFPIAFYCLELLLLILWQVKKDDSYLKFSFFIFRIAYVAMITAMITGYLMAGGGIPPMVRKHFASAVTLFIVSTARGVLWYRMMKNNRVKPWVLIVGALIGVLVVAVTADFGADMVYSDH